MLTEKCSGTSHAHCVGSHLWRNELLRRKTHHGWFTNHASEVFAAVVCAVYWRGHLLVHVWPCSHNHTATGTARHRIRTEQAMRVISATLCLAAVGQVCAAALVSGRCAGKLRPRSSSSENFSRRTPYWSAAPRRPVGGTMRSTPVTK